MTLTLQDKEEMLQYLIANGVSLTSLEEGDNNLSNKYLAPVLEYTGTQAKAVRLAVSVLKGEKGDTGVKGNTGATPAIGMGTFTVVEPSETAKAEFVEGGIDQTTGVKKYLLNLSLPKGTVGPKGDTGISGPTGPAPILEFGKVTTLGPSEPAAATFVENGTEPATGARKFLLNLSLPKGMKGADGTGSGNVMVDAVELLAAKRYVFRPGQDGAANGTFVELELASTASDGLMSKEDKAKLDGMSGGNIKVSKDNIEKVLTGNIATHGHDSEQIVTGFPVNVWDGETVSVSLSGTGTKEDPFLVQSCADYIHLYRNPNLYSNVFEDQPTEEHMANPKYIIFTSNLDFSNHEIDFGDKIPIMSGAIPDAEYLLSFVLIDGQHCFLKNINFKNTWSVFPLIAYGVVKNLHVQSGLFTASASLLIEAGVGAGIDSSEGPEAAAHLFAMVLVAVVVENVSAVCEVKITGNTALSLIFSAGGVVISDFIQLFPEFCVSSPFFYSNIKFTTDDGISSPIVIMYAPGVVASEEGTGCEVTGYDYTSAVMEEPEGLSNGLMVGMMVDGINRESYHLYINADNALPLYQDPSLVTPFHTVKNTAEMKSPEFLDLLNGETGTFVADTEGVNGGYPVFKPNIAVQNYDGYVHESVFEEFKKTLPEAGQNVLLHYLPPELFTITADSTSDEISEVFGGIEGYNTLVDAVTNKQVIISIGSYDENYKVGVRINPVYCMYLMNVLTIKILNPSLEKEITYTFSLSDDGLFSCRLVPADIPVQFRIPFDVMNLNTSSQSDEILTAWGGKNKMEDLARYIGKKYFSAVLWYWDEKSYHLLFPCLKVFGVWNSSSDFQVLLAFYSQLDGRSIEIAFRYNNGTASVMHYKEYKIPLSEEIAGLSALSSFTTGHNTVTTLSYVSTEKQSVLANLSANTTLGLSGTLDNGKNISIKCLNTGSSEITITLLDSGKYVSKDNSGASVTSVTIPIAGMIEISLWALNNKYYVKTDKSGGGGANVIDRLDSTSASDALSANQGRELNASKVASINISTIRRLTQSEYDALTTKDSATLYIIK